MQIKILKVLFKAFNHLLSIPLSEFIIACGETRFVKFLAERITKVITIISSISIHLTFKLLK